MLLRQNRSERETSLPTWQLSSLLSRENIELRKWQQIRWFCERERRRMIIKKIFIQLKQFRDCDHSKLESVMKTEMKLWSLWARGESEKWRKITKGQIGRVHSRRLAPTFHHSTQHKSFRAFLFSFELFLQFIWIIFFTQFFFFLLSAPFYRSSSQSRLGKKF